MKVPTRTQDRGFAFNITPLIDVVFLLIIFFLVASHFIRHEHVDRIELPLASEAREDEESPNRLVVTIIASGELSIGTTTIAPEEFEQRLQVLIAKHGVAATELRIRADRSVHYSNVEPMLITAAKNGVTKVRFAVLKP